LEFLTSFSFLGANFRQLASRRFLICSRCRFDKCQAEYSLCARNSLAFSSRDESSAGAGGRAVVCAKDGAGAMTTGQREYSRSAAHGVETLQRRSTRKAFITQRYIFLRRFGSLFARGQSSKII
jgi:hypothetical protein